MLQQQQQQQVQAGQVEKDHLHIQINDPKIDSATELHTSLDKDREAGLGFFQKEQSTPKVKKSDILLIQKISIFKRAQVLIRCLLMNT